MNQQEVYLEPHDVGAFDDYPLMDVIEDKSVCPKCKGHGGWNLRLNAYPLHEKENTPENRHRYSHFRASCDNCQGYGYVNNENANHIHKWTFVKNIGNCLNLYECSGCGQNWQVDSSD